MIQINLTAEEVNVLRSLIQTCLDDLWVEIQATDNMSYKAMLRKRKEILVKLNEELTQIQDLPLVE